MQFVQHVKCRDEKFGAVIFDTLNEKVFVTNETGGEVLGLIKEGLGLAEIQTQMQHRYPGQSARVEADVEEFVADLRSAELVLGQEGG